jgi:hypothetical protein
MMNATKTHDYRFTLADGTHGKPFTLCEEHFQHCRPIWERNGLTWERIGAGTRPCNQHEDVVMGRIRRSA